MIQIENFCVLLSLVITFYVHHPIWYKHISISFYNIPAEEKTIKMLNLQHDEQIKGAKMREY